MDTKRECCLLLLAGAILLAGVLAVSLVSGAPNFRALGAAAGLALAWPVAHFALRRAGHLGDGLLLPLAAVLTALGLIMVLRLKPGLFMVQALWAAFGLAAYLGSAFFFRQAERWSEYKYFWGLAGIALLLATALFGVDIGGNRNWLFIGPVHFQPSEFAKLFIVLFLAAYLNERREVLTFATRRYGPLILPQPRIMAPLLAVWGLAMLMLVGQRDLGAALLYFGTATAMIYLASGRPGYLLWGAGMFLVGSSLAYAIYPHVRARIDIWLDPWADPSGRAYQVIQSLFALGSGGALGSGLGYGFPGLVPEVHTDFIFAAIGEELGLAGAGAVMLLYILLVYRAFRAALLAASPFRALLAGGLAVLLALQVLVIVGGVTKFLPLTGVTLPLVSYGGSSVVATFILLGMVLAMSEKRPTGA
ncbi:FtsW/RodA/SpoVE family cell cycle protein [Anaeroselena agilis]|uniref:FtsW/RodA/SpoVE family cell cycle protein n=1 Tax=Anaeroselena agilis TaxID=3063788 RepID=A0ABU3NXG2_9FIRM|nr:FtsW/RodA/SpoVE family cell cycle protein [Selenomonadales bacterium 4137-cl]